MTERKAFICNRCDRVEEAKGAKDWPQVKHHGAVYHFCGDPCLQQWSASLPIPLELLAHDPNPITRAHERRPAYGSRREE